MSRHLSLSARAQCALLRLRGKALLVLGLRDRALDAFDDLLAIDASDLHALASRAHARAEGGDRTGAIADLRRLLAQEPQQAQAWFNLGFLLEQQGELGEAETALRRALELAPKLDRAWYGLGLVLIRQQRFDEAVPALQRNTELQPMSPHGWYQLARVQLDRHQPDETVKIIRHLKGFEPKVAAQLERETGLLAAPAARS